MYESHDILSNILFSSQIGSGQLVVPQGMNDATFNFLKNTLMPYIPVSRTSELGRGLVRTNYLNFAPRLGIAWQITPKTVLRTGYGIFYGFPDQTSSAVLSISPPGNLSITASSNQIDPTLLLSQSIFGASPFNRPLTNPSFFAIFDPNMHAEVIQMYNLSVQHQFASSWVAEVGYMGNHGSHLLFFNNVNDALPAVPSDTSTPQSRRRVSNVLGNLSYYAPQGFSNYNAMTLSLEKRYSQGFTVLASYTWSRALGVDPASILGVNSTAIVNPFNLKPEYGPLEFDVIRRGVMSYTYELPVGKGKRYLSSSSKAMDEIVGGWQISGITILQGGLPITPVLGVSLGKTFTNSRPDVVGDPTASPRQPYNWLNKSAFAIPNSSQIAAGDFYGNAGRGSVRAPGLVNFDFSIMKNFSINESRRVQFRGEFFNLMNTPFFGGDGYVSVNFSSPTFGQVTQAGDPRVIQLGLKFIF